MKNYSILIEAVAVNVVLGIVYFLSSTIVEDSSLQYLFVIFSGLIILVILIGQWVKPRSLSNLGSKYKPNLVNEQEKKGLLSPRAPKDKLHDLYTLSHSFHLFIHLARDLSVRHMPRIEPFTPKLQSGEGCLSLAVMERNRSHIAKMLQHVVDIFSETVPRGVTVWACLRDRRGDNAYHTFERAGKHNPNRAQSTQPLHKDHSKAVNMLKLSYEDGTCVIITGSTEGQQKWEPQVNDKYEEDKCVLMGAVMTRSPKDNPERLGWEYRKLTWILCVNADRKDVFTSHHIPLMQSYVDAFSWVANTLIRFEHEQA